MTSPKDRFNDQYSQELVAAKRALDLTLGDNFKQYLQAMRQWFTQQLTKYEFDHQVRQFLTDDSLSAHNRFLLALFNKCSAMADFESTVPDGASVSHTTTNVAVKSEPISQTDAKTDVKPKPVVKSLKKKLKTIKQKLSLEHRFEGSPTTDIGYLTPVKPFDDCHKLSKVSYCNRESLLPDHFMSHLRVFVICWETGLDGVQDNAVKLCNTALRDFIKSILTEVFSSRSSYRLRENRFKYCIGGPPINPYLRNSYPVLRTGDLSSNYINPIDGESQIQRPTVEEATNTAMYWMACSAQQSLKRVHTNDEPINLRHLLYALKTNHNLIPSYSVRCNASFRTSVKLAELEGSSPYD